MVTSLCMLTAYSLMALLKIIRHLSGIISETFEILCVQIFKRFIEFSNQLSS